MMQKEAKFFLERAEADAQIAEATSLENVRSRALRSEKAWRQMAERAERTAVERKQREAETDERRNLLAS